MEPRRKLSVEENNTRVRRLFGLCVDYLDEYEPPVNTAHDRERYLESCIEKFPTLKSQKEKGEFYDYGEMFTAKTLKTCLRDQLSKHHSSDKKLSGQSLWDYFFTYRGASITASHRARCGLDTEKFAHFSFAPRPLVPVISLRSEAENIPRSSPAAAQSLSAGSSLASAADCAKEDRRSASNNSSELSDLDELNEDYLDNRAQTSASNTTVQAYPEHVDLKGYRLEGPIHLESQRIESSMRKLENGFGSLAALLDVAWNDRAEACIAPSEHLQDLYKTTFGPRWFSTIIERGQSASNVTVLSALISAAVHRNIFESEHTPEKHTFAGLATNLHTEHMTRFLARRGAELQNVLAQAELSAIEDEHYRHQIILPFAMKAARETATLLMEHLRCQPAFTQSHNSHSAEPKIQVVLVRVFEEALMLKSYLHAIRASVQYTWHLPGQRFDSVTMQMSIAHGQASRIPQDRKIIVSTLPGILLVGCDKSTDQIIYKATVALDPNVS